MTLRNRDKTTDQKRKNNVIPAEAGIQQGKTKKDCARCWIPEWIGNDGGFKMRLRPDNKLFIETRLI
jgi:hypothetical protein